MCEQIGQTGPRSISAIRGPGVSITISNGGPDLSSVPTLYCHQGSGFQRGRHPCGTHLDQLPGDFGVRDGLKAQLSAPGLSPEQRTRLQDELNTVNDRIVDGLQRKQDDRSWISPWKKGDGYYGQRSDLRRREQLENTIQAKERRIRALRAERDQSRNDRRQVKQLTVEVKSLREQLNELNDGIAGRLMEQYGNRFDSNRARHHNIFAWAQTWMRGHA